MRGSYVSESGTGFSYFPESLQISRHVSLQFLFFSLTRRAKTPVRVSQWFQFQDGRGWGRLLWSLHTTQVSEARLFTNCPLFMFFSSPQCGCGPRGAPGLLLQGPADGSAEEGQGRSIQSLPDTGRGRGVCQSGTGKWWLSLSRISSTTLGW